MTLLLLAISTGVVSVIVLEFKLPVPLAVVPLIVMPEMVPLVTEVLIGNVMVMVLVPATKAPSEAVVKGMVYSAGLPIVFGLAVGALTESEVAERLIV